MDLLLVASEPGGAGRIPTLSASATSDWQEVRRLGGLTVCWNHPASAASGRIHESKDGVALIAGDPVASSDERTRRNLVECLRALTDDAASLAAVAKARTLLEDFDGVFALALAPSHGRYAVLASDHLGVRPLYHARRSIGTFVSTRLGLLVGSLPSAPPPDLPGVLQWGQLDTIYGTRTPFQGVDRNRAAEIWVIAGGEETRKTTYFDWAVRPAQHLGLTLDAAARQVHAAFRDAVRRRCSPVSSDLAFLSGGMDSRMLVHALVADQRPVRTIGFAPPASQDREFAVQFAKAAGIEHRSLPRPAHRRVDWGGLMRTAIDDALQDGWLAAPPVAVWSGDGGSVGMGGVNLSDRLIEAFASGDPRQVASAAGGVGLPRFSMSDDRRAATLREIQDEVATEAEALLGLDPERAARTFLMLHDQRRHLDWYHELLPVHGVNYTLPFYGRGLLSLLAALPAGLLRNHGVYTAIFRQIGHPVATVPYQTYPGHLPALTQPTPQLQYQWRPLGPRWRASADRHLQVRAGWRALRGTRNDRGGIRRTAAAIACALHFTGLRNQSNLLDLLHDLQLVGAMAGAGRGQ